jgi:hypothetical protein
MKLGKYKHYKGKEYNVVAIATHSETLEEMVVYEALYEIEEKGINSVWVRPKKMFEEMIEVNGLRMNRFQYLPKK